MWIAREKKNIYSDYANTRHNNRIIDYREYCDSIVIICQVLNNTKQKTNTAPSKLLVIYTFCLDNILMNGWNG